MVMAPILPGSRVMRSRAFPVRLRRALARSARGRARAARELRSVLPWVVFLRRKPNYPARTPRRRSDTAHHDNVASGNRSRRAIYLW